MQNFLRQLADLACTPITTRTSADYAALESAAQEALEEAEGQDHADLLEAIKWTGSMKEKLVQMEVAA